MKVIALALCAMAMVSADGVKQTILRDKLQARLQRIAGDLDGVMGYAVLDLTTGERLAHLENEVFPTASTIKIAILYELFRRADEGTVRSRRCGRWIAGTPSVGAASCRTSERRRCPCAITPR